MILLFLLQIFNEVDWDCAAGFHSWDFDPSSQTEHRMETTNLTDMDRLLETAWHPNGVEMGSCYQLSYPLTAVMLSDFPRQVLLLLEWKSGSPPEEQIPLRC